MKHKASLSPTYAESLLSPIISLNGVTKLYSGFRALDDISLEIKPGITGLLGPNGSGKSTLIKSLLGLVRNHQGTGKVLGLQWPREVREIRDRVGYLPEDDCYIAGLTGIEAVAFMANLSGLPKTEGMRRAHEITDFCDIGEEKYRSVEAYSTGMRQKLKFAQALVHDPPFLILDEPTTGLDPMSRMSLWEEIRRLNNDGTTVLLTTQYLEEADQLADRVAIIDNGKIVREGRPEALKTDVGAPTLLISVADDHVEPAREVLAQFGEARPTAEGTLGVGLTHGAGDVSNVVRALDAKGIVVEHLELRAPSLDDVFAEATGHRLEGAS